MFHQYRLLAKDLTAHPQLMREIGHHFAYYAAMARSFGMGFAPQLAVFDLGYVVRRAYEARSEAASDLLEQVLALPHRTGNDVPSTSAQRQILDAERCFHEVTDHQVNIEYVPPERREPLQRFCAMLAGTP